MTIEKTEVFRCTHCCAKIGEQHDRGCPQRELSAAEVIDIARIHDQWTAFYTRTTGARPQPMDEARHFPAWLEATRLALATQTPVAKAYHRQFGSVAELLPGLTELPYGAYLLYSRPLAAERPDGN